MVTISKPLSAGQAQAYHANEFTSAEQNYYTQGNRAVSETLFGALNVASHPARCSIVFTTSPVSDELLAGLGMLPGG